MEPSRFKELPRKLGIKKRRIDKTIKLVFFIVFLLAGTYFIWVATWVWPVKIIVFIILFLTLKSFSFPRKSKKVIIEEKYDINKKGHKII